MRHRSVLAPLALVGSVGIALVPALAEAATPASSHHTFVKRPENSAAALKQAGFTTYTSPAAKSKLVRVADSTPNPNLAVALQVQNTSAFGIQLSVTITGLDSGSASLDVQWGDQQSSQVGSVSGTGQPLTYQHTYSTVGDYSINVTVDDGSGDTATNSLQIQTAGSAFTAFGPWRILDTRKGIGATEAPVAPDGTLKLKVGGLQTNGTSIPVGVTAVVLNVTATDETANGVLTVYGDEDQSGNALSRPGTSNVNYSTGKNVPNLVVVPVGANGEVDFYNSSAGSTDIVADVQGYFSKSSVSEFHPVTPTRIIDTRNGLGTGKVAQIPANGTINVPVAGLNGIPASADSVALNLTAVNATANGVISAWVASSFTTVPTTSNLNYSVGSATANMAIVPISAVSGTMGEIAIHNGGSAPVDLIADAYGYFSGPGNGGSAYIPLSTPARVVDTRTQGGPLNALTAYPEPFPLTPATAGIFNATVVSPTGNGYLSLFPYNPSSPSVPNTSNLNYQTGQTIPNLAIVTPSTVEDTADGNAYDYGIYLGGTGTAQVVLDWFGYFQNQ